MERRTINGNVIFNNAREYLKVNTLEWTKIEVAFYKVTTRRKYVKYLCEVLLYKNDEEFVSLHSTNETAYKLEVIDNFAETALKTCLEIYKLYNHLKIVYNEYEFSENFSFNVTSERKKRVKDE